LVGSAMDRWMADSRNKIGEAILGVFVVKESGVDQVCFSGHLSVADT